MTGPRLALDEDATAATPHGRTGATANNSRQGFTLVHFSAQLEFFLWDRGCA